MSSDPTRIDLTHFDALRPANLDPTVWSANLAALQGQDPGLSDELARVALPDHWRPALALDDFVTYRIEPPGAQPDREARSQRQEPRPAHVRQWR